jgi:hypothetical protein
VLLQVVTVVEKGNSLSSDANAAHGRKATDAGPGGGSYALAAGPCPKPFRLLPAGSSSVAFHRLVTCEGIGIAILADCSAWFTCFENNGLLWRI